jgi:hypothetical protein
MRRLALDFKTIADFDRHNSMVISSAIAAA